MPECSSKSSKRLPAEQAIEIAELRERVKTMANLLGECKEVISQNVQERNVFLERIKYLEIKSNAGMNTEVDESKWIYKANRYKSKVNKCQKFIKKQKRDLRLARYLNRRLFEHYLHLYQSIKNCRKSGLSLSSIQSRKVITKSEESDDSLVIPEAIWSRKKLNANNKGSQEKSRIDDDSLKGQQEEGKSPHHTAFQKPKSSCLMSDSEEDERDDPQSEVSLPHTPSSPVLELISHRQSKYSPSLSPVDIKILKDLDGQKKLADKQLDALYRFHDAFKLIKKQHKKENARRSIHR